MTTQQRARRGRTSGDGSPSTSRGLASRAEPRRRAARAVYPDTPGFKADGPSAEAADHAASAAATLRAQALALLRTRSLTADEIAAALGRSVLSVRPRISELVTLGQVEDTGERRRNRSGRRASVWRTVVVPAQARLFAL